MLEFEVTDVAKQARNQIPRYVTKMACIHSGRFQRG